VASSGAAFRRPRKSPITAAVLAALIPGMGHVYLGQYKKGLAYLVGTGALEFLGLDLDLTAIGAAIGVPMELGGLGLWVHGVWDAYRIARQMRLG
jgi:TM2 domain-containing membrane protein YozV